MLQNAGFEDIKITVKENGRDIVKDWIPGSGAENYVTSAYVTATKPRQAHGFRDGVFYGASAACCALRASLNFLLYVSTSRAASLSPWIALRARSM